MDKEPKLFFKLESLLLIWCSWYLTRTRNTQTNGTKLLHTFLTLWVNTSKNPEDEWIFHFPTSVCTNVTSGSVAWTNQGNIHLNSQKYLALMEEGAGKEPAKSWGLWVVVLLSDKPVCLCQRNMFQPIPDRKSELKGSTCSLTRPEVPMTYRTSVVGK